MARERGWLRFNSRVVIDFWHGESVNLPMTDTATIFPWRSTEGDSDVEHGKRYYEARRPARKVSRPVILLRLHLRHISQRKARHISPSLECVAAVAQRLWWRSGSWKGFSNWRLSEFVAVTTTTSAVGWRAVGRPRLWLLPAVTGLRPNSLMYYDVFCCNYWAVAVERGAKNGPLW